MVNIIWADVAVEDLQHIFQFIAIDSPKYAQQQVDRIINRVDQLEQFPQSGRVVPEFNNPQIRELIEGQYRIVYQIDQLDVLIARVHHAARPLGDF